MQLSDKLSDVLSRCQQLARALVAFLAVKYRERRRLVGLEPQPLPGGLYTQHAIEGALQLIGFTRYAVWVPRGDDAPRATVVVVVPAWQALCAGPAAMLEQLPHEVPVGIQVVVNKVWRWW